MGDDFNYGERQVKRLGDLSQGGRIKLTTESGETRWQNLSPDRLRRIAAILAEPED